jgi:hypothetical protein
VPPQAKQHSCLQFRVPVFLFNTEIVACGESKVEHTPERTGARQRQEQPNAMLHSREQSEANKSKRQHFCLYRACDLAEYRAHACIQELAIGVRHGTRLAPVDELTHSWHTMLLQKGQAADALLDKLAAKTVARGGDVVELTQSVRAAQAAPEGRPGRRARRALAETLRPLAAWNTAPQP